MAFKIEAVHAYISEDENGEEGIIAMSDPMNAMMMPMICADQARFESMRPYALQIARVSGQKVKIIRLTQREELGVLYDPAEARHG